ncbi:hypothetical protein EZH22_27370 [Xanthobacter dioxanivorans]|uniref:Secreted protein n=1 Tax=Xanthobacter dioxanivorans TaxID=2528964 RepID=A0A974PNR2_9HYPH|nr:hypothetical protein [Xanthobacter dioxanivorans]QRG06601.1 hypothetical protein EZH22_27370 [Xanthobacter dioxanivorans]
MRAFHAGSIRIAVLAATVVSLSSAALGQSDPLTPPPDLGAAGVPVPIDGTAIYGQGTPPPEGMMAIPVPPSTCSGLSSVVRTQGFILVPTGGGNAQRYVRDERYCAEGQTTSPAWLPTADNPRCFVGYTCGTANNDGGN